MKKNTLTKTAVAFSVGAVTGMMFAPKKGEDLRQDIAKTAKKGLKKVKNMKKEECEMIEGVASEVKEKTKDIKRIIED